MHLNYLNQKKTNAAFLFDAQHTGVLSTELYR